MTAGRIEIRLLGKLEISIDGVAMPEMGVKKAQLLFGFLVLRRGLPVQRAQIAAMLWPYSAEEVARFNLRRLLLSLRKDLGGLSSRLGTHRLEGMAFDVSGCWVDLAEFRSQIREDPKTAVELYRGPLLEDLKADWLDTERTEVENAYLNALEALADAADPAEAETWLRKLAEADPLRESALRKLMVLLADAGDFMGAIRLYRKFKRRLKRELSLAPSGETKRLVQELFARQRQLESVGVLRQRDSSKSLVGSGERASLGDPLLKGSVGPDAVLHLTHPNLRTELPGLSALEYLPNNLPAPLTSFVGRERQIAQLELLLTKARLLTLTGSGGCGKSRLSIRVAADQMYRYPDGVWLVELASLSEAHLVLPLISATLGVKEEPGTPVLEALIEFLKPRRLLLLLDNCEHLLPECRTLVSAILRSCPQVQVLATSREAFTIAGEQTFQAPSLSLPNLDASFSLEELARFESVRLFLDRATLVKPDFELNEANALALAQICVRLDGIPLAIELAAARVRSMSGEEIRDRLRDCFRLLVGGDQSGLPRHQTLRSLIDWSYDLLNDPEKELFSRLSVFAGGWTAESAEKVCGGEGVSEIEVFDLLTSLADKSLAKAESTQNGTRYTMLETVRQYGGDRLQGNGTDGHWKDRHAAYFVSLAEAASPQIAGQDQKIWLDRLESEHDNLRAALTWSLENRRNIENGLRLAGSIWNFWSIRGYHSEAIRWLSELLEASQGGPRTASLAKVLVGAGYIAAFQIGSSVGRAYYEEALVIRQDLGDRLGVVECLNGLGIAAQVCRDLPTARSHFEAALALVKELGDPRATAVASVNLGEVIRDQGDLELSRICFEESLAFFRQLGNRSGTAYALGYLGMVALDRGDCQTARTLLQESLSIFLELDDRLWISYSLARLGEVFREEGDLASARRLTLECLENVHALRDLTGAASTLEALAMIEFRAGDNARAAVLSGASQRIYQQLGAPSDSGSKIPDVRTAFAASWEEGRRMPLAAAIEYAREGVA